MSIKTDEWIRMMGEQGMITPFEPSQVRKGVVSYGLSSMGYDFRLDDEFFVPTSEYLLNPKYQTGGRTVKQAQYILNAGEFVLGKSIEYFRMPDDVIGICYGKSTYARLGVQLNMTPIEPGWCGHMTICISNIGYGAVVLYAYEGIGQITFHQAENVPLLTYAAKQGKYQDAQGIMVARVED